MVACHIITLNFKKKILYIEIQKYILENGAHAMGMIDEEYKYKLNINKIKEWTIILMAH